MQRRSRKLAAIAAASWWPPRRCQRRWTRGDRPDTIDLPAGFAPEGVAVGRGGTFYAGSRTDGRIARGTCDVTPRPRCSSPRRTVGGHGAQGRRPPRAALGRRRGAPGRPASTTSTPATASPSTLTDVSLPRPSFINDVVVTRDAAYFTNSQTPGIYKVPISSARRGRAVRAIPLAGRGRPPTTSPDVTNLNGIEATSDGRTLIVVNSLKAPSTRRRSHRGQRPDRPGRRDGDVGDGILLVGRDLLVLETAHDRGANQISSSD